MAKLNKLTFLFNRVREQLWVRPLVVSLLSIAAVFIARGADHIGIDQGIPHLTLDSVETLLSIMASSMLMIAVFAVGSMVSAYNRAGSSATPRSFSLIIADDISQNALSVFIGAFIFSLVALTATHNAVFQDTGLALLFVMTVVTFGVVILTFVRWVNQIARLGRLDFSVEKVEAATAAAMKHRRASPTLCGVPAKRQLPQGQAVYAASVGYVQHIDIAALQTWAEKANGWIAVAALPGTFVTPERALAYVGHEAGETVGIDPKPVAEAVTVGRDRRFDEDPRFGLVVLSEIADKALSPGVNDPGTAITIIGSLTRLFVEWVKPLEDTSAPVYDRVEVPELSVRDMFDDAFTAIARDGAGTIEVMLRLQKMLKALASLDDSGMRDAALAHSRLALARAEKKLDLPEDQTLVREAAAFSLNTHRTQG